MIRRSLLHSRSFSSLAGLLATFLLACSTSSLHAQTWQWSASGGGAGNDRFTGVTVDREGNTAAIGGFTGDVVFGTAPLYAPYGGVAVAKYDPAGVPLWLLRISGSGRVLPGGIAFGPDGFLTVVGTYSGVLTVDRDSDTSSGGTDVFILRLDRMGRTVWLHSLGGPGDDTASAIAVDSANNAVMTGTYAGSALTGEIALSSVGERDVFIASYGEDGAVRWARTDGGTGIAQPRSLAVDAAGGIVVAGYATDSVSLAGTSWRTSGAMDGFVAAYTSEGLGAWSRTVGGEGSDVIHAVSVDKFGTIYLAGEFEGSATVGSETMVSNGSTDMFVARLRSDGGVAWVRSWGTTAPESMRAVATDNAGKLWAAGSFTEPISVDATPLVSSGMEDVLSLAMNSSGNVVRARTFGGGGNDRPNALAADNMGEALLAGEFQGAFRLDSESVQSRGLSDCLLVRDGAATAITAVNVVDGGYCPGAEMTVRFSTSGRFSTGSGFRAELSDSAGSFDRPSFLGAMQTDGDGVIHGRVPDTIVGSRNYRIRVISALPARTSAPNPIPIQVYGTLHPRITPSIPAINDTVHLCPGQWVLLDAGPWYYYFWSVIGNERTLNISRPGRYYVIVRNEGDCEMPSPPLYVVIDTIRIPTIERTAEHRLECITPAVRYQWFRDGDTLSDQVERALTVDRDGRYTVEIATANGCTALSAPFTYQVADVERGTDVPGRITPHPVAERARLLLPRPVGTEATLVLLNERGAEISTEHVAVEADGHVSFDASRLPTGHYLVRITGERGTWLGSFVKR